MGGWLWVGGLRTEGGVEVLPKLHDPHVRHLLGDLGHQAVYLFGWVGKGGGWADDEEQPSLSLIQLLGGRGWVGDTAALSLLLSLTPSSRTFMVQNKGSMNPAPPWAMFTTSAPYLAGLGRTPPPPPPPPPPPSTSFPPSNEARTSG